MTISMQWHKTIAVDDLWDGDMMAVRIEGREILLLSVDGEIRAYDNRCPHQFTALSTGDLDRNVLTCPSHLWEFDALSGEGLNPKDCRLVQFQVRVEDGAILVGLP
jgi:toluene monooxygenase system ferredoxin subunit